MMKGEVASGSTMTILSPRKHLSSIQNINTGSTVPAFQPISLFERFVKVKFD